MKLGYGGTKAEMQRLLDDANRINKEYGKITDYQLDSYADIVDAIHTVQEEMGIAGTTELEALTTIQGAAGAAKAAWQNWLVALADPELDITEASEKLISQVKTLIDVSIPRVVEIAKGMWQVVGDGFELLPENIQDRLSESLDVLRQAIDDITPAWESFTGVLEGFRPLVEPIGEALMNIWDTLVWALTPLAKVILTIGTLLVQAIISFLEMAHNFDVWWETAPQEFMTFVEQANTWIGSLPAKFWAWFSGILSAAGSWAMSMVNKGNAAIQGFLNAIKSKWGSVASWFGGMGGRIKSAIGDLGSTLLSAGKSVLQGFWDGLKSKWDGVKNWLKDITSQIPDWKGPEDVDAKLLVKNGHLIMDGLLNGMQAGWSDVEVFLQEKTMDIPTSFSVSETRVSKSDGSDRYNKLLSAIVDLLETINDNLPDGVNIDGREFGRLVKRYA